ncbi:hypothetical protein P153DRAFT_382936 [Dothidotthia symphoricarpi CBS 119687]|uniref:Uncharacterized protein n=1 Tax=Dothidotthia symphoricarpi CBS 119687 TaxID=1392245 RepID=A0A6A6AM84_9PLEO|nr:uncharacterized protein P153DRAFT_382936 [Dothidotthia symphoricarpi CBS 119687]KAF2132044.1 hypothetical protein P153DRAFT_382936 [Dothidotthia symphoricarpi CBS 119687]
MPQDRHSQNNPRPLKPAPASTRAGSAKTPLTPRLAVAPAAPAPTTRPLRTSNGAAPRLAVAVQDDATPVKSVLGSNVSPRSASRKSRIGASSTASASTSNAPSRPPSALDASHGPAPPRLAVSGGNRLRASPAQTPRLPLASVYPHVPSGSASARLASPTFFHANDVRPPPEPTSAPSQKKASAFFYANGKQDDSRKHGAPSPPLSSIGRAQSESKFFHADSISEVRSTPPVLTPVSTSPEPPSTRNPPSHRPASPTKDFSHLSYRKGASQVMRPALHSRNSGLSVLSAANPPDVSEQSRRRSSAASSIMRANHVKSASLSSIDSVVESKTAPSNDQTFLMPSPLHTENHMSSNGSRPESLASAPSPPMTTFSGLPSPRTSVGGQSALEMMNELAANARRERKVLDLEISNSSLLAINRSLEKEVRKQKAELRRYRRLTLSGRFSTGPTDPTLENDSTAEASDTGKLSDMDEDGETSDSEDSDSDSEQEDLEDSSEHADSIDDSAQSSSDRSSSAPTPHHHIRDEKRLQLDLTKHHSLLLDSQKMNQSLKRCLGWTEQLIKDGQKALAYKVHASDVKLGGRVLVVEDDADANSLLSPWSPLKGAGDSLDLVPVDGLERAGDRDSGVDVRGLALQLPLGSPFEDKIRRLYDGIGELERA